MIHLPDFDSSYEYENAFYLSCKPTRIGKLLSHYELYKKIVKVPGEVVECGVFKGASLSRFIMLRELLESNDSRKILGFDSFGKFPDTDYSDDKKPLEKFIADAGDQSISVEQMLKVLEHKQCENRVSLIKGNILETIPKYLSNNPELKISLLHVDVDVFEATKCVLEYLFPRLSDGGVVILDDYGIFPGATQAIDDYFSNRKEKIEKLPFSSSPSYMIKQKL